MLTSFLVVAAAEIVVRGLGFVTTARLAQALLPERFGQLAFALVIFDYCALTMEGGLSVPALRYVAQKGANLPAFIANVFFVRGFLALLLVGTIAGLAEFAPALLGNPSLSFLYVLILLPLAFSLDWMLRGLNRLKRLAGLNIVRACIYMSGILFLIRSPQDLEKVPLVALGAAVLYVAGMFLLIRPSLTRPNPAQSLKVYYQCLPLLASAFLISIYYSFDTILLKAFGYGSELGFYSAAYKIISALVGFAVVVQQVLLPLLARSPSVRQQNALVALVQRYLIFGTLAGAGLIFVLAKEISGLVYGPAYAPTSLILQFLIWQVVTVFINVPYASLLLATGQNKSYLWCVGLGAILNVSLNLVLIPALGTLGAAIATVIADAGVALAITLVARPLFKKYVALNWLGVPVFAVLLILVNLIFPAQLFLRLAGWLGLVIVGLILLYNRRELRLASRFMSKRF